MNPPGSRRPIVVGRVSLADRLVHTDPRGRHVQIHTPYPSVPQRNDIHLGAGKLQRAHRYRQLDLLEAVGRQGGDPAAS